ncbi:MAG: hypothetical protein ACYCVB_17585, partial [Bacilli bacterium]
MKPLNRRILAVVSTSVVASGLLAGSALANSSGSARTAQEPTLTIATGVVGGKNPQENAAFANAIGQALHCKVQLISTTGNYDQKMMVMLASGQKIDVVYTEGNVLAQLAKAGEVTN